MSSYDLGLKLIRRMVEDQQPLTWHKAKLGPDLFRGPEIPVFDWVDKHVRAHHALPQVETLMSAWPVMQSVAAPEPASYYVEKIEHAFFYSVINQANIDSQSALKADQDAWAAAMDVLTTARARVLGQRLRTKIMDLGVEAPKAVLTEYHGLGDTQNLNWFGWDYMDTQSGGVGPGDVISFVGRPAQGKTWMMLYIALHNWRYKKKSVLFVSMEMSPLAIAQRLVSMYAHIPYGQLKTQGMSSETYGRLVAGLQEFKLEERKFYVVDGNLAVSVDEIFDLADLLECECVVVDGAYLLQHQDKRLDRYARVAENVRAIKRQATALSIGVFCSWQFGRSAVKGKKGDDKPGMEDIGMSDEIPQVSSIVLALDQEDSVETLLARRIRVIKGRSGEVGAFNINWGFNTMDFTQYVKPDEQKTLEHI